MLMDSVENNENQLEESKNPSYFDLSPSAPNISHLLLLKKLE